MKIKCSRINESSTLAQRGAAVLSIVALLASTFAAGISAQSMKAPASKSAVKLSEDQRILHMLNRLGFGARPGDLERVKAMGIDNYITQQLFPEKIDDSASEAKLQNLGALRMTSAELYEKYPQPGKLLQQLQRRGALPADLAAAQANRQQGGANARPNANAAKTGDAMSQILSVATGLHKGADGSLHANLRRSWRRHDASPNDASPHDASPDDAQTLGASATRGGSVVPVALRRLLDKRSLAFGPMPVGPRKAVPCALPT